MVDAQVVDPPVAGRLLAVSVGQPQEVAWRGRVVRTAIWKTPVADRRRVWRLNLRTPARDPTMLTGLNQ